MTPLKRYQRDLDSGRFHPDQSQRDAVEQTQDLYQTLVSIEQYADRFFHRLLARLSYAPTKTIKGLYLWGGVGRGKTWIVDSFYDCLPFEQKLRMHFHRFMRMVHQELRALGDIRDPLQVVAGNIAAKARVICFDEFHVTDITDAMLLGGLLQALFEQGVVLVVTSNTHPDKLYWDGLQRRRFLPAIELLKQYTNVINVEADIDYRLRYLEKAQIYHHPLDEQAQTMLLENFQRIAPDAGKEGITIDIEGRPIKTVRCTDGVVWFDFRAICDGPRGPADYIEIGRLFQTVLIGKVPQMDENQNDLARRFLTLVDEFYDRNVKLIITAAAAPEHLYLGRRLLKPFKRTISRLIEMQSHDYLARQHLCD